MTLGKILSVFIVLASSLSLDVMAGGRQEAADTGCRIWCKKQKDDDEHRYIGGKCAGDRVIDIYGHSNDVGCDVRGCNCEKRSGDYVDKVNENVVDENGSEYAG